MYALNSVILFVAVAYAQAGRIGLGGGIGLVGSVDGGAIISGPSGVVTRAGLASLGPVAAPGLITAGVAPGAVITGSGLGLGGLGLGIQGLPVNGLGLNAPGLVARALGLEGSGIEGQWVPDINEKLYDDGSYRPGLDH